MRTSELFPGAFEESIDYFLVRNGSEVNLEDSADLKAGGLSQTVLIFGGPGSGKTFLYTRLLEQYLGLNVSGLPPGGLILDPKGVLEPELRRILSRAPGRAADQDLIVLSPSSSTPTNILDVGNLIAPRTLGHLLADVIITSFKSIGEGWESFLYEALEGVVVLKQHMSSSPITLADIVRSLTKLEPATLPGGQRGLRPQILAELDEYLRRTPSPHPELLETGRVFNQFVGTLEARQMRYISQLVRSSLGSLSSPQWSSLNDSSTSAIRQPYNSAFVDGKILLVSIGEGESLVRSVVSTIVKALFQIVVASRFASNREGLGWRERSVLIACDEYAQVLTERSGEGLSDSLFFSRSREFRCLNLLALQSVHMGLARVQANSASWNSVLGNSNTRIFMSVNDSETASLGSGMAGQRPVLSPSESWTDSESGRHYSMGGSRSDRSGVPEVVLLQGFKQGEGVAIGRLDGRTPQTAFFTTWDVG